MNALLSILSLPLAQPVAAFAGGPTAAAAPVVRRRRRIHTSLGIGALMALLAMLFQLVDDNRRTMHDRMARGRIYGHTLQVLFVAESLRGELNGALLGERGYLLTENEAFLAPLVASRVKVPGLVRDLDRLTSDNPNQRDDVDLLALEVASFMEFMESEVVLETSGNHAAAMERLKNGDGLRAIARLTTLLERVVGRERRLLVERRTALDSSDRRTERSLATIFWAGLAMLLLAFGEAMAVLMAHRRIRKMNEQLRLAATTDALTGLRNRRSFFEEFEALGAGGEPAALALIDVDHFKSVNDRFGHPAGDEALRSVATALAKTVRKDDVLARIGGEEFAVLMPGATRAQADEASERLRAAVAKTPVELDGSVTLVVTISIGLAMRAEGELADGMITRADKALYDAKTAGRNRVALAA